MSRNMKKSHLNILDAFFFFLKKMAGWITWKEFIIIDCNKKIKFNFLIEKYKRRSER